MKYSRRDVALLLPALAAAAQAQDKSSAKKEDTKLVESRVYRYGELPVKTNGTNQTRQVFDGATHTGYHVDLHLTDLGPGMAPHPPHKHTHEEMVMLESGQLDVTLGSVTTRVEAGSVVWAASNLEHGWRNPGPGRAQYFVMALGREGE
ncbi:MAG: cupin domain-containing protein [Bryobacteraceae bacterium]|jgi:quercetin dioxygenase-like cupin family protein